MNIPTPITPATLNLPTLSPGSALNAPPVGSIMQGSAGLKDIPGESFADKLNRAAVTTAADQEDQHRKQVEKTAGDLVSTALILPILKQLRRDSLDKDPIFGGGDGEKTFGPEFDMQIADRIAQSPNLPIRKALVERMLNRGKVISKPATPELTGTGISVNG